MAEQLRKIYSPQFIQRFLAAWKEINSSVDALAFANELFAKDWMELELKARMQKIAESLKLFLPDDYPLAAIELSKLSKHLIKSGFKANSFEFMFLPNYIELFGQDHPEESLEAIEVITVFTSCEFAIRPFIIQYPEMTMRRMIQWSVNPEENVRRLSSEGCRARLPWAKALPTFKKNASPILPILEKLKNDPSLFVRKSVANNLNDISKDHPELALKLAKKWKNHSKETDWIVKHGMRTLLKNGHPEALQLFGYSKISNVRVTNFHLSHSHLKMGEAISLGFTIENKTKEFLKMRLEYGVYFLKANGTQNRKVFKISEPSLASRASINIKKKHKIERISSRKYYSGEQQISLIVNGVEMDKKKFLLKK